MEENAKSIHKGFKIFIIIFIIGTLFILKDDNRIKALEFFQSITIRDKSLDFVNGLSLEEDVESVKVYKDTIVKWKANKITFLNFDGKINWEKEYNFLRPEIVYGHEIIYVVDKSTGDIYSMDIKGDTIGRIQLEEEIFNLKESNGHLMVHIKNSDMESINILDKEGNLLINHKDENSYILNSNLSTDNSKYIVCYLNMSGDELKSQVAIYSIKGEVLEEVDFTGEIVLYTEFIKDELIVLTEKNLYYVKDGKIQWKRQFPLVKDINIEKDKILILYDNNFETIDLDGRTIDKMIFAHDYKEMILLDKNVLLYGNHDIIGIQGNKEIFKYKLEKEIIGLYHPYKSSIYIHTLGELENYKIKNKD